MTLFRAMTRKGELMQLSFAFMGTETVNLDPSEFVGLSRPQLSEAVLKTLRDINPRADFFASDVEAAADALSRP